MNARARAEHDQRGTGCGISQKHSNNLRQENNRVVQQQVGNQAIQGYFVQPKLTVSRSDDPYEKQADKVANEVMRKPAEGSPIAVTAINTAVQRRCTQCEEEETVQTAKQRDSDLSGGHLTASQLHAGTSAGHKLSESERTFFEPRFGHDLSGVRIHTGTLSNQLAQQISARAFTHGNDIVFAAGHYQPETRAGRRLLAHEITHVLQQRGNSDSGIVAREPVCSMDDADAYSSEDYYSTANMEDEALECRADDDTPVLEEGLDFASVDVSALSDYELLIHYRSNSAWLANNPMVLLEWVERDDYQQRLQVEIEQRPTVATVAGVSTDGKEQDLDTRVAAFKGMVKMMAKHRLHGNRRSLEMWRNLVENQISNVAFRVAGFSKSGGMRAYREMQDERNPMVRELRAEQAYGRFRACSGCHFEVKARDAAHDMPQWGNEWLSPNEQRQGVEPPGPDFTPFMYSSLFDTSDFNTDAAPTSFPMEWLNAAAAAEPVAPSGIYSPPAGSVEARLNTEFPNPEELEEMVAAIQPLLDQLGEGGYQVIPDDMFEQTDSPEEIAELRQQIMSLIDERMQGFMELTRMIDSGEVEYGHFAPVVRDLLPLQDEDVRQAIQDEMDSEANWALAEAIIVGIFSVIALVAVFFPPTSALGVAALGAIEVGLAGHALYRGAEMMDTAYMYSLGTGADDVFSPAQQASASSLAFRGALSILGGLAFGVSGTMRLASAAPRLVSAGSASESSAMALTSGSRLAGAEGTFEAGQYSVTIDAHGRMVATMAERPDLLVIVEEGMATLYQQTGTGLRVLESSPLTVPSPAGLLPAGEAAAETVGVSRPLALGEGARPLALLPEYAESTMAANWMSVRGLIGEPAATATLPADYIRYQNAANRWVIARRVADDTLYQRLFVDAEGLIQISNTSTRASTTGFMNNALRQVSDPGHPLHFLVTRTVGPEGEIVYAWNTTTRVSGSGTTQVGRYAGAEHAPVVQAGHQSAFASGEAQAFMLEDAGFNITSGAMIESRGAYSFKSAVDIQGVRVDYSTALMYERLGLLQVEGGVASLPRIPAPGAP